MTACHSEFALDRLHLSGDDACARDQHVGSCAHCQARLQQRRQVEAEFEQSGGDAFWRRVAREYDERRRRRRNLRFAFAPLVACAAALLLVAGRSAFRPQSDQLTAKGPPVLELHCRRGGRAYVLGVGDAVQAGDELRFVPRTNASERGYIQVGSVDGTGAYTPFYPDALDGNSVPLPAPGQPLAGSIRLDDAPGPERLFVVVSRTPLSAVAVRAAALIHVKDLSATTRIDDVGVGSTWVVLDKNAPSPR